MHSLGIDVLTKDLQNLLDRLRAKPETTFTSSAQYPEDRSYSQVNIAATITETELEDWLYTTGAPYIGTFTS